MQNMPQGQAAAFCTHCLSLPRLTVHVVPVLNDLYPEGWGATGRRRWMMCAYLEVFWRASNYMFIWFNLCPPLTFGGHHAYKRRMQRMVFSFCLIVPVAHHMVSSIFGTSKYSIQYISVMVSHLTSASVSEKFI